MVRVLITGGTGFLGSYLAQLLVSRGDAVSRTYFVDPDPFLRSTGGDATGLLHLDVRDPSEVSRVLEATRPDVVYHFAGQPYVKPSWEDPLTTFQTNVDGTIFLLEWLRKHSPRTKFGFAGSSAAYGIAETVPTPETNSLRPVSPYASSKAAGDLICYQYTRAFGLPTYRFRIFATTGPGKQGDAPNDFAIQVARLERDPAPRVLKVGTLETRRDFGNVRDAVKAMATIVEKGTPGEAYNIGSGRTRPMREIAEGLQKLARVPIEIREDPDRLRKVDEPVIHADISRLRALGWAPEVAWEETLRELLDHWRAHPPAG